MKTQYSRAGRPPHTFINHNVSYFKVIVKLGNWDSEISFQDTLRWIFNIRYSPIVCPLSSVLRHPSSVICLPSSVICLLFSFLFFLAFPNNPNHNITAISGIYTLDAAPTVTCYEPHGPRPILKAKLEESRLCNLKESSNVLSF